LKGRLRRGGRDAEHRDDVADIDPAELTGVFAAPQWLRDIGFSSWLLVGAVLLLVGTVWLLTLINSILMPLIAAGIIAAVASPVVGWLAQHRVPRGIGAALMLLAIMAFGMAMFLMILAGITSQEVDIGNRLASATHKVAGWFTDPGVDAGKAQQADQDASNSVSEVVKALLGGLVSGMRGLSSLVFFLSLAVLSLFFLLKDGPTIRAWGERHLGVPIPVARVVTGRSLGALRGYFLGVTIIAVFNAFVVGGGALLLGVPLVGTIAAVTFIGAYIPYLGAWSAGAFSVLLALGGAGPEAAAGMVVVQLLANGVLQQLVQPIAYGAALGIHPLAVLVVTIGGGCLFGAAGLVLAAPVTSAVVRISADLARAEAKSTAEPPPEQAAAPAST